MRGRRHPRVHLGADVKAGLAALRLRVVVRLGPRLRATAGRIGSSTASVWHRRS